MNKKNILVNCQTNCQELTELSNTHYLSQSEQIQQQNIIILIVYYHHFSPGKKLNIVFSLPPISVIGSLLLHAHYNSN